MSCSTRVRGAQWFIGFFPHFPKEHKVSDIPKMEETFPGSLKKIKWSETPGSQKIGGR